jgi:YD repeat-containing protein
MSLFHLRTPGLLSVRNASCSSYVGGEFGPHTYDALRRPTSVTDPLGRVTDLGWCSCGGLESLTTYKDGTPGNPRAGAQVTTWLRDLMGRVTDKIFPDAVQAKRFSYSYEPKSGRLQEITTGKNNRDQKVQYRYYLDNNLAEINYLEPLAATADVSFEYDPDYERLTKMIDGTGTTIFGYKAITVPPELGAGRLETVDGPLANDTILYTYDPLGRVLSRKINGAGVTVTYDSLGRLATASNPLGTFTYNYLNMTALLASVASSGNQVKAEFTHYPNVLDERLREINNLSDGSTPLSKFDYTYDAAGRIEHWTQQADSAVPTDFEMGYDNADQLRWSIGTASGTAQKTYSYTYDSAGNRKSEQVSTTTSHTVNTTSYNADNQPTGRSVGGSMLFRGSLNEPAKVRVNGNVALTRGDLTFTGETPVSAGLNTIPISAADARGNSVTRFLKATVSGSAQSYGFDENGNLTSAGSVTYQYDGADRLVTVINGALRTDFTYDGFGRRVRIAIALLLPARHHEGFLATISAREAKHSNFGPGGGARARNLDRGRGKNRHPGTAAHHARHSGL